MTLVELLVVMLMLGLFGSVIATTFVSSTDSLQRSTWRQENTRLAQVGMENLTKSVRASSQIERATSAAVPAFDRATPTGLRVHAFLGSRPVLIDYGVDADGKLIETRRPAAASSVAPYWTFVSATHSSATRRIVIDRVINTSTQPLFTYRDATGAAFAPGELNESTRRGIRSVEITLHVQTDDPGRVRPAQVTQRVQLPNLGSTP